jgi:hypothetical protein
MARQHGPGRLNGPATPLVAQRHCLVGREHRHCYITSIWAPPKDRQDTTRHEALASCRPGLGLRALLLADN